MLCFKRPTMTVDRLNKPRQLKFHLLGWHTEGRTWFQLVLVLLLPSLARRTHPRPLFLVAFHPIPLPLFFPPHPLLLTLPLSFPLPLPLPTLPLAVISLPLSVPVPFPRVAFALLLGCVCSVFNQNFAFYTFVDKMFYTTQKPTAVFCINKS